MKKTQKGGWKWYRQRFSRKLTDDCKYKWLSFKKLSPRCKTQRTIVRDLNKDDAVDFFKDKNVETEHDVCEKLQNAKVKEATARKIRATLKKKWGLECEQVKSKEANLVHGDEAGFLGDRDFEDEDPLGADQLKVLYGERASRVSPKKIDSKVVVSEYDQFVHLHSTPLLIERTQMELDLITKLLHVASNWVGWIEWKIETFLSSNNQDELLTVLINKYFRGFITKFIPELLEINEIGIYLKQHKVAEYVSVAKLTTQLTNLIISFLSKIASSKAKEGDPSYATRAIIYSVNKMLDSFL